MFVAQLRASVDGDALGPTGGVTPRASRARRDARSLGCALAVLRSEPSAPRASCWPYVLLPFVGGPQCGSADAFEPFGWEPPEGEVTGGGECVVQFVGDDDARRACDVDDTSGQVDGGSVIVAVAG